MRRAAALLAALLALAGPASALAQCPRTSVADLEDEIMCPVCGTSLATAGDAPLAVQQRRLIDRLVQQCRSKDQIKTALVAQYGEAVLAEPEKKGFGLTTYLVPGIAFLAGAAAVGFAWLRWRRARGEPAPAGEAAGAAAAAGAGAGAAPGDTARLDEDMRRYDL
ncbi:MAG TPA: cytochrome c-type biogenesis protein CcmH [Thermoleophilaceae bacterium]